MYLFYVLFAPKNLCLPYKLKFYDTLKKKEDMFRDLDFTIANFNLFFDTHDSEKLSFIDRKPRKQ